MRHTLGRNCFTSLRPHFLFVVIFSVAAWSFSTQAQIQFNEIDYVNDRVELVNRGSSSQDVTALMLCANIRYGRLDEMTLVSGNFVVPAGGFLVVQLTAELSLADTGNGLGLYKAGTVNFGSSANILDYVRFGTGNNPRESVAESAGLWTTGESVPLVAEGNTVSRFNTAPGRDSWAEGSATLGETNQQPDSEAPVLTVDQMRFSGTVSGEVDQLFLDETEITLNQGSFSFPAPPGEYLLRLMNQGVEVKALRLTLQN